jgi:hypothetical protein
MNELEIFGVCIIILIVITKSVILIRYLQKISKKSYYKYKKSNTLAQMRNSDSERVNNRTMDRQSNSESRIIQESDFLTYNPEIFY